MIATFYGQFSKLTEKSPCHIALQYEGAKITRENLLSRADRVAGWMERQNLSKGDLISVWLPNSFEWVIILLACSKLGIGIVSLNTRYKAEEMTLPPIIIQFLVRSSGFGLLSFGR